MKNRVKDPLKWISVAAAIAATSTAEYDLARAIGMEATIAASVPVALDAYVVRALWSHKEVLTSVLAMVGVNAASHLVTAGLLPLGWQLITAVSAIPPLVLWRVHALQTPGTWRARKLWGIAKGEHVEGAPEHDAVPDVPASTPTGCVHGHAVCEGHDACTVYRPLPDVPPVPAADGMPFLCEHGCSVWGDLDEHMRSHQKWDVPDVPEPAEHADDLDVPDFMKEPIAGTLAVLATVPVPPPAFDPVLAAEHADDPGETEEARVLTLVPPLPEGFQAREHVSAHDVLNEGHVASGVLDPRDVPFMEQARVLAHREGTVPTVRAVKEAIGTGTPRAQRLIKALKLEGF